MSNNLKGLLGDGKPSRTTIGVGHGNYICVERIVAILESGSLPVKRLRERALEEGLLIDATAGRKMRSLIITDSRHVVLSAIGAGVVQDRLRGGAPSSKSAAQREQEEGEFVS